VDRGKCCYHSHISREDFERGAAEAQKDLAEALLCLSLARSRRENRFHSRAIGGLRQRL